MKITYLGGDYTLDVRTCRVTGEDEMDAGLIESVCRRMLDDYSPALGEPQAFLKEALEKSLAGLEARPDEAEKPEKDPESFIVH